MRPMTALQPFLVILALWCAGCVERRMTIRSVPANALVVLDGQELGFTPCSTSFDYYGTRQIKIVKDGFETRVINQRIAAPWYEWPGIDFLAEVLLPWRIRDERDYVYELQPNMMVPNEELAVRAEQVRQKGLNPDPRMVERATRTRRAQTASNDGSSPR